MKTNKTEKVKSKPFFSLAYLITILLILVSALSVGSSVFLISNYLLKNITKNAIKGTSIVLEKVEQAHTTQVTTIQTLAQIIAKTVEKDYKNMPAGTDRKERIDFQNQLIKKYESLFSKYLSSSPDFVNAIYLQFDTNITLKIGNLIVFRHKDGSIKTNPNDPNREAAMISGAEGSRNWFVTIRDETHKPTWIRGLYDKNENLIAPYAVPIYIDGKMIGGLAIDLNLNSLRDQVYAITLFETGHIFLLNTNNNVVLHKEVSMFSPIGEFEKSQEGDINQIVTKNQSKEVLFVNSVINGDILLFKRLTNGWTIGGKFAMSEVTSSYTQVKLFITIVMIVVIGAIFVLSIFLQRFIKRKMDSILDVLSAVKIGNFTKRLTYLPKNEFGLLSIGINSMIEEIKVLVSNVNTVSNYVAETSDSLGASMIETNQIFVRIKDSVSNINDDILAQAASTEEISASMDHFRDHFRHLNQISGSVATEANEAVSKNAQWLKNVEVLNETSQKRISSTQDVEQSITRLGQRAREINTIVGIISDIVEQTNLLALNASIEAARAGESGKGFAVVAEEVRSLAEQSQREASNIQGIVNNINEETENTANHIAYLRENTRKEKDALTNADHLFKDIYSSFELIIEKIQDLNSKIEDMNRIQENVAQGVAGISESADQNAVSVENIANSVSDEGAIIEQVSMSAQELKKLSEELRDVIGRFVM